MPNLIRHEANSLQSLEMAAGRTRSYAAKSKAKNTQRAYWSDWTHFTSWCMQHQFVSLPATPETIVLYICDLAETRKVATIERRLASISQAHKFARLSSPTVDVDVTRQWLVSAARTAHHQMPKC